ncbi:MAG TPA: winged helix-turn-helix transcriptional regulator, partial [Dehalococcoidia bacterium]
MPAARRKADASRLSGAYGTTITSSRRQGMTALDQIDVQLLRLLRQDASVSISEIAKRLYLSPRTVRSRIQRLRESGVIRFTICINREK